MTAFEEFGVMPEIGKAVDDMDWNLPTDVQVGRKFVVQKPPTSGSRLYYYTWYAHYVLNCLGIVFFCNFWAQINLHSDHFVRDRMSFFSERLSLLRSFISVSFLVHKVCLSVNQQKNNNSIIKSSGSVLRNVWLGSECLLTVQYELDHNFYFMLVSQ